MVASDIGMVGLGLRREMLDDFIESSPSQVDFLEVAPENWLKMGGKFGNKFKQLTDKNRFIFHGLSLSLGSPGPLDVEFVTSLKSFFKTHNVKIYSEHLSYCSGSGHMYDLMPIPFTEDATKHVVGRIKQVQDILEQRIAVENVSYYAAPGQEMSEQEFTLEVLKQADCDLLLDVNNIYVNSVNHGYDAIEFLRAMPSERIVYGHVAGHYEESTSLLVDTHGADVCDPVWDLLEKAYDYHGLFPTLLERDFNIPSMKEVLSEVDIIKRLQSEFLAKSKGVA